MDIEKLAEITAQEFGTVHAGIAGVKEEVAGIKIEMADVKDEIAEMKSGIARIESSQKAVLEAILEIPTKKSIEWLTNKVEDVDKRIAVVERKLQTAH